MDASENLLLLINEYKVLKQSKNELLTLMEEYNVKNKGLRSEMIGLEQSLRKVITEFEILKREFGEKIKLEIIKVDNLQLIKLQEKENCVNYALQYSFLGNAYNLVKDCKIIGFTNAKINIEEVADLVVAKFDKYGESIFSDVLKLETILQRYTSNPELELKKLVIELAKQRILNIQSHKQDLEGEYNRISDELTQVLIKLRNKGVVKESLLNKIFRKNQLKLQQKRDALIGVQDKLKAAIDGCDLQLTRKGKIIIKNECVQNVQHDLEALSKLLDFINIFKERASKFAVCSVKHKSIKNQIAQCNGEICSLDDKMESVECRSKIVEKDIDTIAYKIACDINLMSELMDLRKQSLIDENGESIAKIVIEMRDKVMNLSFNML